MTNITKPNAVELKKWRAQAQKAAAHLKSGAMRPKPGENFVKVGFVFDDDVTVARVITLELTMDEIRAKTPGELAQTIYDSVLTKAQEHTPPAGHA